MVTMGSNVEYTYNCYGVMLNITSPFIIKIIDYGVSHVQNVDDGWVESNPNIVLNGGVSNVYDDFFDLSLVTTLYFLNEETVNEDINNILQKNSFTPYTGSVNDGLYYVGREYNPDWYNIVTEIFSPITDKYYNNPIAITKSVDGFVIEVLTDFSKDFKVKNIYSSEGTKEMSEAFAKNKNNTKTAQKILKYQREYGGVMKYNKLLNISRRKLQPKILFDKIMQFTS